MNSPSGSSGGSPPSTRTIARLAGISATAVSMALRDHQKISQETRKRVKLIAARLGYRPDPQVGKLMNYLRSRRKTAYQASLCALTDFPSGRWLPYLAEMADAAKARAGALGYGLSVMTLPRESRPRPDLQRVLLSRGVEGLLLLPIDGTGSFEDLLDWSRFSVLSATYGVLAPEAHRVVPHQFGNMLTVCRELSRAGYRRIGLVLSARHDLTVHHGFTGAVLWQNVLGGSDFVRPLVGGDGGFGGLEAWFRREKPDAIVTSGAADALAVAARLRLRIPGRIAFAVGTAGSDPQTPFAGIEERPREIGARAVELLAGMVQRGEKGVPKVPSVTMIEGTWRPGPSVRTRSRR